MSIGRIAASFSSSTFQTPFARTAAQQPASQHSVQATGSAANVVILNATDRQTESQNVVVLEKSLSTPELESRRTGLTRDVQVLERKSTGRGHDASRKLTSNVAGRMLRHRLTSTFKEVKVLQAAARNAQKSGPGSRSQAANADRENAQLARIAERLAHLEKLEVRFANDRRSVEALQEDFAEERSELDATAAAFEEDRQTLEAFQAAYDRKKGELAELRENFAEDVRELEKLQASHVADRNNLKAFQQDFVEEDEKLKEFQGTYTEHGAHLESMQADLIEDQDRLNEFQAGYTRDHENLEAQEAEFVEHRDNLRFSAEDAVTHRDNLQAIQEGFSEDGENLRALQEGFAEDRENLEAFLEVRARKMEDAQASQADSEQYQQRLFRQVVEPEPR